MFRNDNDVYFERIVCKMKKIACILLLSHLALAQTHPVPDTVREDIRRALGYLEREQCTRSVDNQIFMGEWPAYMQMHTRFLLLGTRQKARDSNCFTTAAIHNTLAEMYLADTSLKCILPMLKAALPEILSYATDNRFNFWKKLPPYRDLRRGPEPDPLPWVRRPTHYPLKSRYINNAANVENDADDTASGNLAVWMHQKIFGDSVAFSLASYRLFDQYTDQNRQNRHWYNYLFNGLPHSGGYMTWLGEEKTFKRWNIVKTFLHNQIFFLPMSVCYPTPYQPYVPYGTNDLDAVVNANVLCYLAQKGELTQSVGRSGAVQFIEHQVARQRWRRAAHYYPNRFHLHYAVARAWAAGDTLLTPTMHLLVRHLVASQHSDGHFESRRKINQRDVVQSTTYALLALLYCHQMGLGDFQEAIEKAIVFLQSRRCTAQGRVYWDGGVFFSGGTVVRGVLYFTSDAYTTALIAQAFQMYLGLVDINTTKSHDSQEFKSKQ